MAPVALMAVLLFLIQECHLYLLLFYTRKKSRVAVMAPSPLCILPVDHFLKMKKIILAEVAQ
jgi:hypothetical protein